MDRTLLIDGVKVSEYDLYYKALPPIPTAEQYTESVHIKGRDAELTKKYGYLNIEYPIELYFYENESFRKAFRKSKSRLLDAKTISFADDDEVFYKIKTVQISTAESEIFKIGMFSVIFTLDPFMYEAVNNPISVTEETTIKIDGYDCMPIIKALVSGTGRIYVNGNEIVINGVNGQISIDSEQSNAYRDGNPPQNMNNNMAGEFPILKTGDNVISYTGAIDQLEIICNKRWR